MKSIGHFRLQWVVGVLASGALGSAFALNPQPLPPGAHGVQREGNEAVKMRAVHPEAKGAAAGAAQKGSMAGSAQPASKGASTKAGAGAAKFESTKTDYMKQGVPAVQRR